MNDILFLFLLCLTNLFFLEIKIVRSRILLLTTPGAVPLILESRNGRGVFFGCSFLFETEFLLLVLLNLNLSLASIFSPKSEISLYKSTFSFGSVTNFGTNILLLWYKKFGLIR